MMHRADRKIKLLFIIDFIYTLTGGTENQLVKLINNINNQKYDIYLLSLRKTKWLQENSSSLNCNIKMLHIQKIKNPFHLSKFFLMYLYLKKLKPDIVMTFFPLSNIWGVIISKLAGVKSVFSTRRDYGLWLKERRFFWLRFANLFVNRIITNSAAVKELTGRAERFNLARIDVIYNGIDPFKFQTNSVEKSMLKVKYGIPDDVNIVGTISGLKPMKRHLTILNAAKIVIENKKDTHFLIVGDGTLRADLEKLSINLGITNHVHFMGSQENVLPFLSLFDVAVNSSANEGLSNAIMEYMAYGVPCVVSQAGGNTELIKDGINGYTFELDNANQLADKILLLLADRVAYSKFSTFSKNIIDKKFSIANMIYKYDILFKNTDNRK